MKFLLSLIFFLIIPSTAFAGDAVTMVISSGATIELKNGYSQLSEHIKKFNKLGSDHYMAEIKVEGASFYLDLGQVVAICRDTCGAMKITLPKKEK